MLLAVKENEAADPVHIGFLRAAAEIAPANCVVHLVEQARLRTGGATPAAGIR